MMNELCRLGRKAVARVHQSGAAKEEATSELADLPTWFIEMYCVRFVASHQGEKLSGLIDMFAYVVRCTVFKSALPQAN